MWPVESVVSMATISHWGVDIEAEIDWLLEDPILTSLTRSLADNFVEIERWDLSVIKAVLDIDRSMASSGAVKVKIQSFPDLTNARPGAPKISESEAETAFRTWLCPECHKYQLHGRTHPEDGCNYGVVDNIMSS